MRRFRESGAAAFVVACALLVIAACIDEPVGVESEPQYDVGPVDAGSHFRYATLSWAPTATPNEIRFRLIAAFRRTAYFPPNRCFPICAGGFPGVGDTISENQGATRLNFGDGPPTTGTLRFVDGDRYVGSRCEWALGTGRGARPGNGNPGDSSHLRL